MVADVIAAEMPKRRMTVCSFFFVVIETTLTKKSNGIDVIPLVDVVSPFF